MWPRVLNAQSKSITAAAVLIGSLSLASRFLGMVRDRILAGQFGAGAELDIYYAAFRIPDTIYNLVILGTISAGLIPVFTSLLSHHQKNEAWKLINSILTVLGVLMGLIAALFWVAAPWIMPLITPGFSPASLALVTQLTRIMLLSPVLMGFSAVCGAILQSHRRFLAFSLAPLFYNLGIIFGALVFVNWWGVVGLAWGVVLGALLHFVVQCVPVASIGYSYRPRWDLQDQAFRRVVKLMIPRVAAIMTDQLQLIVATIVASAFAAGSLAIYSLAINLQSLPLGLFSVSLAVAALPVLSELAAQKKYEQLITTLSGALRQMLFFILPVAILLYVLRAHVVRIVLGAGAFDWTDTRLTAAVLGVFCLGIFSQGALPLVIRGFYALHNTRTPLIIGTIALIGELVGIGASYEILAAPNALRTAILAVLKISDLATTADVRVLALPLGLLFGGLIELSLALVLLRRHLGRLDGRKLWASGWRIACASLIAGSAAYGTLRLIGGSILTDTFIGIALHGGIAGLAGLLTYVAAGVFFKIEELYIFTGSLRRKLFKQVQVSEAMQAES